ncbi:GNAT family N-acetyltransferase [Nonomuraea rhodomycinica]|uniref:GNAT family N-acetyltransferase n=1 Tax=Nonomuraea rhodomycinica TaxID=1712872 RepID=A0A7Y6IQ81_9ACTN|nr:GNAT family N-acetyltransferase [Nonomuraea rhodomycinica]NUW42404.1 GNAT family N-acetyltransferase [Nonomuraea rhodomycinica]
MAWQDVIESREVRAVPSPLESARFGRPVERLTVGADAEEALDAVREAVLESAADVIVLRYPAERVGWFAGLTGLGRTAIFADCLVYWSLRAGRGRPPAPAPGLRTGPLGDPDAVGALVADIFAAYGNHYLADPLLDPAAALAGYQEWAARSAAEGSCVALHDGARALGIATLEDDGPRTEILLAGVVSAAQGRGLYAHLLKAVEDHALARGGSEVVISTQSHNTRVQRAWARYGFVPVQAHVTVHLVRTALLSSAGGTAPPRPAGA